MSPWTSTFSASTPSRGAPAAAGSLHAVSASIAKLEPEPDNATSYRTRSRTRWRVDPPDVPAWADFRENGAAAGTAGRTEWAICRSGASKADVSVIDGRRDVVDRWSPLAGRVDSDRLRVRVCIRWRSWRLRSVLETGGAVADRCRVCTDVAARRSHEKPGAGSWTKRRAV